MKPARTSRSIDGSTRAGRSATEGPRRRIDRARAAMPGPPRAEPPTPTPELTASATGPGAAANSGSPRPNDPESSHRWGEFRPDVPRRDPTGTSVRRGPGRAGTRRGPAHVRGPPAPKDWKQPAARVIREPWPWLWRDSPADTSTQRGFWGRPPKPGLRWGRHRRRGNVATSTECRPPPGRPWGTPSSSRRSLEVPIESKTIRTCIRWWSTRGFIVRAVLIGWVVRCDARTTDERGAEVHRAVPADRCVRSASHPAAAAVRGVVAAPCPPRRGPRRTGRSGPVAC